MSTLRYEIQRTNNVVSMKILAQPEETRGAGCLFRYRHFEIRSNTMPDLTMTAFYIRGCHRDEDDREATIVLESTTAARAYFDALSAALEAYNRHLTAQPAAQPIQSAVQPMQAGRLRYQFDRIGKVVVATPISIPAVLTTHCGILYKTDDFRINREDSTSILSTVLYLPGSCNDDPLAPTCRAFESEEKAMAVIQKAARAIAEFNRKLYNDRAPTKSITKDTVVAE